MSLTPGARLGAYEVVSRIGAGGMGVVYRARDTALNRDVALKVLPDSVAGDPDRLRRFQREAQALAALNHSNVAQIYGLVKGGDTLAIAMELVEGPTLAERLVAGPVRVEEALVIARQVAQGLEAAHERGILHRDLKPANIKVREDGTVKLLDFGLAKAIGSSTTSDAASSISTVTAQGTAQGVVLGTAPYMAPEQAKGTAVDQRADVWAFACVLFEMLTGRRAFDGADATEVIAAVINTEPDWKALPRETPLSVRRLLRRATRKDRRDRLGAIVDARLELDEAIAEPGELGTGASDVPDRPPAWKSTLALAVAASLVVILGTTAVFLTRGRAGTVATVEPVRFRYSLPEHLQLIDQYSPTFAISPDGRRLLFSGWPKGAAPDLFLLDTAHALDAEPLNVRPRGLPFFSPDGRSIGYVDGHNVMWTRPLDGGVWRRVTEVPQLMAGVTWGRDGTIVIGSANGLFEVPETGGELVSLGSLTAGESHQFWPQFSPDGRFIIFSVLGPTGYRPAWMPLASGQHHLIAGIERGSGARYVSGGYLVWLDGDALFAAAFDLQRGELTGDPIQMLSGVASWSESGLPCFAVSDSGHLVYAPGGVSPSRRRLVLVDATGHSRQLTKEAEEGDYSEARFSPDGSRVIVSRRSAASGRDLWLFDMDGRSRRLTATGNNMWPRWTPDGRHVTHMVGYNRLVSTPVFDNSEPTELIQSMFFPSGWHPTEPMLLLENASDVFVWRSDVGGAPKRLLESQAGEVFVDLSPDGRWIAYQAFQPGPDQIYVRPLDATSRGVPITRDGGRDPRWSHDGRRVFFWGRDEGDENRLMVVELDLADGVHPGPERVQVRGHYVTETETYESYYDVSPTEDLFVMEEPVVLDDEQPLTELTVVVNWLEELKTRVSVR